MMIRTNMMAMHAHRQLGMNQRAMQATMEKLASGQRINRAADDAAGLSISEKMRGQIRGLGQAERNIQDGVSLIQTAEGALNETHSLLQRMRELSVQAANGTNTAQDRKAIQAEIDQLTDEMGRIGENTEFNTRSLLDGSFSGKMQLGANAGDHLALEIADMRPEALLGEDGISVMDDPSQAIGMVDEAIQRVSGERTTLGAYQNRLGHAMRNASNQSTQLQAAESRIRDADMAKEIMAMTQQRLLNDVALAMLAHTFESPRHILRLLP
ncbi:flagellin [Salsuginibacillus halophilus]|uniref:Flagellin n=1 Tax=Salsuginibacillus halophilus TaxID=517424 RepID=A0A2P8HQT6_9BACI|nr:flagellin [Salsuginibacillus halophilus]PSL48581.1 flagellin [Salsuginibacillus halophilus]